MLNFREWGRRFTGEPPLRIKKNNEPLNTYSFHRNGRRSKKKINHRDARNFERREHDEVDVDPYAIPREVLCVNPSNSAFIDICRRQRRRR